MVITNTTDFVVIIFANATAFDCSTALGPIAADNSWRLQFAAGRQVVDVLADGCYC